MLLALQYLLEMSVIHGVLKPENVLMAKPRWPFGGRAHFKVIDFGGARNCRRIEENMHIVIQTLPYRAPEVLLGLPFTCAADIWSLGCICVELFVGTPLFPHNEPENIIVDRIVSLFGEIPPRMLR